MTARAGIAAASGLLALLGCALWFGGRTGPEPVRPARLEELDRRVRALLEHELAAVERRPRDCATRLHLGMAYEANGLFGEAARSYRQALELDPTEALRARVLQRLACARERLGDLQLAADTLAEATAADPTQAAAWARLAWWRLDLSELEGAEQALERLRTLAPGDPLLRLGEVRLALARHEAGAARALLEEGDLLQGERAACAEHLLAQALRQQGDLAGAERAAARATELGGVREPDFDDPGTREMQALETGLAALRLRAGRDVLAGRFALAEQRLRLILEDEPDDAASLNALGLCRLEQGDATGALELFARALALEPEQFEAAVNQARALLRSGNAAPATLDEASALLVRALSRRPDESGAWRVLAALAEARRRPDQMRAALDRAVALEPAALELELRAAYAALESGDPDDALARFGALQQRHPELTEAWFGAATTLIGAGRAEQARPALESLAARPDADPARLDRLRERLAELQAR